MKIRTKILCFASLVLCITFSKVPESGAHLLDGGGLAGSYVIGQEKINIDVGFGTTVDSVDDFNPDGPVTHNYPPPHATASSPWPSPFISGYGDAGSLSQGTLADAHGVNRKGAITTEIGNIITVGATAESGKVDGDLTALTFQFQMDGATNTSSDRNSPGSSAIANTVSVFQIWDPSQEDIDFRPYLFDFDAYIWDQTETLGDGSRQHDYEWRWKAEDYWNQNPPLDSDAGGSSSTLGYHDTAECLGTPENPSCNSIFDTGLLTFTINTYVGAELYLWGWMQSISEVSGSGGHAYNGFLNTLGGALTAADGVVLTFADLQTLADTGAGSDPVPEPATMLLLGTGLAGLAGIRRRKRA